MKRYLVLSLAILVATVVFAVAAQEKAAVEMNGHGPFHPGDPITFNVKLNAPMPKNAHFDLRISPVSADEEISLGTGQPVNGSDTDFRVSGVLPQDAYPGEWHISVIWFFLPGAGWTHRTLSPNDLRFKVEGKPYEIPTEADVTIAR